MKLELISNTPESVTRSTPLLFIHGAWHGAWCWEEHFLPYFAERGYRAHAISLRGHGESERPAHFRWMRISDYVADVAQVVDQLPHAPVLIGHSMGGLVVQKYIEKHTVPAAVLLASVPVRGVLRTTFRIARRHPLAFLKANLTWSLYPVIARPELAKEAFFSMDIPPAKLRRYFSLMQDESYLAFLDMMCLNLPDPEKVSTALLILGAENDTIFRPEEVAATAAAYNTTPEFFEKMAHDMMLENGWQSVADRILGWLAEKGL